MTCSRPWTSAPLTRFARSGRAARPYLGPICSPRAFTLVEMIFVMVLLTIVASMVAPRMSAFFRGRVLTSEARRMLSLIQYGQARASAEGAPVVLWVDAARSSYGLEVMSSYTTGDLRAVSYTTEPTLTLETSAPDTPVQSELGDELLGLPEGLPSMRFNPDGFFEEGALTRVVIRQGTEAALEIVPTANRLSYEIRPLAVSN